MVEIACKGCGLVFTLDSDSVPAGLVCYCQNHEFELNRPEVLQNN